VAEAIREVVSTSILFDLNDPRVHGVTVLNVEVTGDLRNATVYVSIMGTDAERRRTLRGLGHAAGFIQAKVAARLQTRTTPHLRFEEDQGVKRSIEISRLIDKALADDAAHARPEGLAGEEAHQSLASPAGGRDVSARDEDPELDDADDVDDDDDDAPGPADDQA
jgi:ribosome-binding factor A